MAIRGDVAYMLCMENVGWNFPENSPSHSISGTLDCTQLEILRGQSLSLFLSPPWLDWKPGTQSLIYVNRKKSVETNREELREIFSPK